MTKGQTIQIEEIHNGVMISPGISPFREPDRALLGMKKEIIAFQNAEDFIEWIKAHFSIFTVPSWDNDATHT